MASAKCTVLLSLLLIVQHLSTVSTEADPRIIYTNNGGQNNGRYSQPQPDAKRFQKLPSQYQQKVYKYQDVQGKPLPTLV